MFPVAYILDRRLKQLHRLPWPIPANVIIEMTELDFDRLDMAQDCNEYWRVLNAIVARLTDNSEKGAA